MNFLQTSFWTLLGALLSIILYPLIIPFIEGPIQSFLTKIIGKGSGIFIKKKIKLSGEWVQIWVVEDSANFPSENEAKVLLTQIGKQVYGRVTHGNTSYTIKGTIEKDMYLTGIWDDIHDGNNYKGAFQLYIHKYASHMTGKWLGYSEKNVIKTGDWHWKRVDQDDYKKLL